MNFCSYLQRYIAEYLGISTENSEAVLDALEAQHGLLIERAKGIYSFSHLTFQEYFAAQFLINSADQ
jgi:predicted NACHT family NTPase